MDRFTIPNILTASRIAMAAVAALLAWHGAAALAVSICITAAWLDVFDGWYARRFARGSSLGMHLDPLADKVLMGVVYAWVGIDAASALVWVLIGLIGAREIGVTVLRSWSLRKRGRFIPARPLGRLKMFAQSVAGLTILGVTHYLGVPVPLWVVCGALVIILGVSCASGAQYLAAWRRDRGGDETGEPAADSAQARRVSAGR